MQKLGITVKFKSKMHEKIAIIDRKVKWVGSLNILSHNTNKEYMEKSNGESSAKELFDKFDLDDLLIKANENGAICPKCNIGVIVFRASQYGKFYGCSDFSKCKYTAKYP